MWCILTAKEHFGCSARELYERYSLEEIREMMAADYLEAQRMKAASKPTPKMTPVSSGGPSTQFRPKRSGTLSPSAKAR